MVSLRWAKDEAASRSVRIVVIRFFIVLFLWISLDKLGMTMSVFERVKGDGRCAVAESSHIVGSPT